MNFRLPLLAAITIVACWWRKSKRGAQRRDQDAELRDEKVEERAQCLSIVPFNYGEVIEMNVLQPVQKLFTYITPWQQGGAELTRLPCGGLTVELLGDCTLCLLIPSTGQYFMVSGGAYPIKPPHDAIFVFAPEASWRVLPPFDHLLSWAQHSPSNQDFTALLEEYCGWWISSPVAWCVPDLARVIHQ